MENKNIYTVMAEVMEAIASTGIQKTGFNELQKYKFRAIDEMYNTLAPIFAQYKLLIFPEIQETIRERVTTAKGAQAISTVVKVKYTFATIDGSSHSITTFGEALDTSDKSLNKAFTAAYKYAMIQTFSIPFKGDSDADNNTLEIGNLDINQSNKKSSLSLVSKPENKHEILAQIFNKKESLAVVDNKAWALRIKTIIEDKIPIEDKNYEQVIDWLKGL